MSPELAQERRKALETLERVLAERPHEREAEGGRRKLIKQPKAAP
jgi:hypothetical protein